MSGTRGVTAIKQLMNTGKHGAISVLQAISKDGFQIGDVFAPLASDTFKNSLEMSTHQFQNAIVESKELDFFDNVEIAKHAWTCWKDIATEGKLAIAKIKAGREKTAA